MSINKKLKWLQLVDEYKHLHKQLGYTRSIAKDSAGDFQAHYEEFCRKRNIDLKKLNQDNKEKINKAYGVENGGEKEPDGEASDPESPGSLAIQKDEDGTDYVSSNSQDGWSEEEKEIHEMFARLFKKIAQKIHPDKLASDASLSDFEKQRFSKLFQASSTALDERKYFVLLDTAEELNIEPPKNYEKQLKWLKKESIQLREETQKERMTYNYLFSESETEAQKDNVIRQFIQQLFGIYVE